MAYIKPMTIYTFFLTLFTFQILFGEGRQIKSPSGVRISYTVSPSPRGIRKRASLSAKSDHNEISPKKTAPQTSSIDYPQTLINQNNFMSLETRRSPPRSNHIVSSFEAKKECSPGAGNSFLTNRNSSPNSITESKKAKHTLAESEDDYRRTSPGRSPGAGHAVAEDNRELNYKTAELQTTFPSSSQTHRSFFSYSAVSNQKDFRPPSLPSSGHVASKQDDINTAGNCLRKKCTNDLRPTKPGDSPRAGHSFVSKSHNITLEHHGAHFEVRESPAGHIDDYRPTTPSRSPGAGHASLKENRKLNA